MNKLEELERTTTDQLVVVTVSDLRSEIIEALGLRLGNGWSIGREDTDNGVLLIVAPADKKTRIEVGTGLEGLLTDAKAAEVVATHLVPAFGRREYAVGILAGVDAISTLLISNKMRPLRRDEGYNR